MNYSFPLAFAFNFFSTTILLIILGMSGKSAMAADVGIIQGATLALFYAFSANARNMILNKSSELTAYDFASKRFILFIPLSIIAYYLCVSLSETGRLLALIIIL
ncbi:MAG: hypothetical protein GTO02_01225, partial [Candidatus Dadabacteria bacterium]|nr:hypothetical protein [Candidatus Dadabacteria bacterium]